MKIKHYLFAGILPVMLLTGCMGGAYLHAVQVMQKIWLKKSLTNAHFF